MDNFINRTEEIKLLNKVAKAGGLVAIYGRRRLGKTRLLSNWIAKHGGIMCQAVEASSTIQLEQIYTELKEYLNLPVQPKTWSDFLIFLTEWRELK